jgi:hypothetical protein
MRWLIAILLVIHGLIHAGVATAPDRSKGEAGARSSSSRGKIARG